MEFRDPKSLEKLCSLVIVKTFLLPIENHLESSLSSASEKEILQQFQEKVIPGLRSWWSSLPVRFYSVRTNLHAAIVEQTAGNRLLDLGTVSVLQLLHFFLKILTLHDICIKAIIILPPRMCFGNELGEVSNDDAASDRGEMEEGEGCEDEMEEEEVEEVESYEDEIEEGESDEDELEEEEAEEIESDEDEIEEEEAEEIESEEDEIEEEEAEEIERDEDEMEEDNAVGDITYGEVTKYTTEDVDHVVKGEILVDCLTLCSLSAIVSLLESCREFPITDLSLYGLLDKKIIVSLIERCPRLETLYISSFSFDDDIMISIGNNCPRLLHLDFMDCGNSEAAYIKGFFRNETIGKIREAFANKNHFPLSFPNLKFLNMKKSTFKSSPCPYPEVKKYIKFYYKSLFSSN